MADFVPCGVRCVGRRAGDRTATYCDLGTISFSEGGDARIEGGVGITVDWKRLGPGSADASSRHRVAGRSLPFCGPIDLRLRTVKTPHHLRDGELLVIEVEHRCVELHKRTTLDFSAADSAILVQGKPVVAQAITHPLNIVNLLRIVWEMVNNPMDMPPEFSQTFGDAFAQAPIEEELRRLA